MQQEASDDFASKLATIIIMIARRGRAALGGEQQTQVRLIDAAEQTCKLRKTSLDRSECASVANGGRINFRQARTFKQTKLKCDFLLCLACH